MNLSFLDNNEILDKISKIINSLKNIEKINQEESEKIINKSLLKLKKYNDYLKSIEVKNEIKNYFKLKESLKNKENFQDVSILMRKNKLLNICKNFQEKIKKQKELNKQLEAKKEKNLNRNSESKSSFRKTFVRTCSRASSRIFKFKT